VRFSRYGIGQKGYREFRLLRLPRLACFGKIVFEKVAFLADSIEAQFQSVDEKSAPAVMETVNEAMHAYEYAPESKLKLTSPLEVPEANKGLTVGKSPGP
jgi:hypothetical protein